MRGVGRVFKRKQQLADGRIVEDPIYWIAYYHRGKEYRESSGSESEVVARRKLSERIKALAKGRYIPNEERLTFEDMVKDLENEYQVNGRRSLSTAKNHTRHLREFFGMDRAVDITPDRVLAYQTSRLAEGASRATANREVACLGRMLSLAVELKKLSFKPKFKLLDGERVRQGFLEHGDFLILLGNLPDYLKPVVEFLYLSGWRKSEALKLEWRDVDLAGQAVRLRIENSKNKEARVLPLTERLWEIIQERAKERRLDCLFVFHHQGQKIGDFKKAWKTACKRSGLEGTLVHDLRRCAARNLSRAGVHEQVAMNITGHKTNSMYRRYRIVDERDLREATERLQAHLESQGGAKVVPLRANQ
ncbi:MAG: site-specific integrase [Deltaproteobacteria bacterium]|nr:site-specific integrase [Deltaproteobacteria bacterium]